MQPEASSASGVKSIIAEAGPNFSVVTAVSVTVSSSSDGNVVGSGSRLPSSELSTRTPVCDLFKTILSTPCLAGGGCGTYGVVDGISGILFLPGRSGGYGGGVNFNSDALD